MVDPYTGKQVKEGKSKAPLVAASESVAVGKPWSYALRGQCILPARPVVMIGALRGEKNPRKKRGRETRGATIKSASLKRAE